MQLHQLRSFLNAARMGSMSRAARAELLTVQTFSLRISTLEQELGFTLFERTPKGVALTPAGKDFVGTCEQVIGLLDAGVERAGRISRGGSATVRIGVPWRVFPLLQELYVSWQELHPNVSIEFVTTIHDGVFRDLVHDRYDVVFMPYDGPVDDEGVTARLVGRTDFVIACAPASELAKLDVVHLEDLAHKTVYTWPFRFMADWPKKIEVLSEICSGETTTMRCLSNVNHACLYSSDTVSLVCPPLVARPLADFPTYGVGAYCREGAGELIGDLIDYVAAHYEKMARERFSF